MVEFDTVVVGAGPAGLSAALYTSRAGLSTAIVGGDAQGGLLLSTEEIDNYLGMPGSSGEGMAADFLAHAIKFGATLHHGRVSQIDSLGAGGFQVALDDGACLRSRSVVFAAGSNPRRLGVMGEDLDGVSYCATCDGSFYEGEDVAVVGGGETAVEDALYLAQGSRSVTVLVRGGSWRASPPAVEKLLAHPRVEVHMDSPIVAIHGDGSVESISVGSGVGHIPVTGVFVAVGQEPNSSLAEPHVTLFSDGFIRSSNVPGFFVAGDIAVPEHRQVAVAVGDGARAGIDATRFLLQQ